MLLLVSLLLVLMSFVLIWTWGYRYYSNADDNKTGARAVQLDSASIANHIRDSLQKVYDETLQRLDTQLDSTLVTSDSIKAQLEVKLNEFFRLSNEIKALLKEKGSNRNFGIAKQKIGELQNKVEDLKDKNQAVDTETKSMSTILEQLKRTETVPEKNGKQVNSQTNTPAEKFTNNDYALFYASDVRLLAMVVNTDDEAETSTADRTSKLVGSFTVVNNISQMSHVEMMVVVLQPDGKVLKNSEWDAGSFNTPDGKKVYSYKLSFSYSKGEQKRLSFSLKTDKYQKGNYTMQVYFNGVMIGKTSRTLS